MPARLLTLPLQCGFHPALRITRIRVHRPRNSFPKGLPATAISISLTAFHDCLNRKFQHFGWAAGGGGGVKTDGPRDYEPATSKC